MNWEKNVNWEKLEIGLKKYQCIMNLFTACENFNHDFYFQKKFKGFYRVRRNQDFCDVYFKFLNDHKVNEAITFGETLKHIYDKMNRVEASFASKLVATVNPNLPVWDKEVLNSIGSELNKSYVIDTDRIESCVEKYEAMKYWYNEKLASVEGEEFVEKFDNRYPNTNLTNLKKIDLILWQTR